MEQRRHAAGYRSDGTCQRCLRAPENEFHAFWECLCNRDLADDAVVNSQHLCDEAVRGKGKWEVFWCRGLVPHRAFGLEELEVPDTSDTFFLHGDLYSDPFEEVEGLVAIGNFLHRRLRRTLF